MKISKTSLLDEAVVTGFRPDTLEKVIRNEREFVSALRDKGELLPELLSKENEFIEKAKIHPGLLRRADMSKKKGTS